VGRGPGRCLPLGPRGHILEPTSHSSFPAHSVGPHFIASAPGVKRFYWGGFVRTRVDIFRPICQIGAHGNSPGAAVTADGFYLPAPTWRASKVPARRPRLFSPLFSRRRLCASSHPILGYPPRLLRGFLLEKGRSPRRTPMM
jgi:hypothetical protein